MVVSRCNSRRCGYFGKQCRLFCGQCELIAADDDVATVRDRGGWFCLRMNYGVPQYNPINHGC